MNIKRDPISGDVLFEFSQIGQQMRIAAIHAQSGVEVVVTAPIKTTRPQMQQLALGMLKRRMARQDKPR